MAWELACDFPVQGNEVYLDFDQNGVLWSLVRDDYNGCIPALCTAEPPYSSIRSFTRLPMKLHGPMVKRLEGGCVIAGRQWDGSNWSNVRTDLFWLEDGQDIRRLLTLPSGGDTSYAGWADLEKGRAAISYYSSHEYRMDEPHVIEGGDHLNAADIYLADVSYA